MSLHCLSAFCPLTTLNPRESTLSLSAVSIAFRRFARSLLDGMDTHLNWARPRLHCLSAFCPLTTMANQLFPSRNELSPLPFGVLPAHYSRPSWWKARRSKSPLPFGVLPAHYTWFRIGVAILFTSLHCLSAFCPLTTSVRILDCQFASQVSIAFRRFARSLLVYPMWIPVTMSSSPLPFGVLPAHYQVRTLCSQ